MISHLRGTLARKNEIGTSLEIDVGGVWYRVELPAFVWRAMEEKGIGDEVELETFYFVIAGACTFGRHREIGPGSFGR